MAITYEVLHQDERSWGIDVTVSFFDPMSSQYIHTATFRFDSQKQIEEQLETRMVSKIEKLQYEIDHPEPPPLTREEVENELIKKGYLEEGQSFEDLLSKVA